MGGISKGMLAAGILCLQVFAGAGGAAAAPADLSQNRLLVLDLRPIETAAGEVKVLDGLLASSLGVALGRVQGPSLATTSDLRTLVDMEATKMETGCDTTSCLAEVGEALGAGHVVSGTVGKLGKQTVVTITLFEVATGRSLSRVTRQARSVSAIGAQMDDVAAELLAPWLGDQVRPAAPPPDGPNWLVIGGATLLATGTLVGVGSGAGVVVLDQRLAAGSGASTLEKQQALDLGLPVIVGVGVGAAVAILGGALVGVGATQ